MDLTLTAPLMYQFDTDSIVGSTYPPFATVSNLARVVDEGDNDDALC